MSVVLRLIHCGSGREKKIDPHTRVAQFGGWDERERTRERERYREREGGWDWSWNK